MNLSDSVTARRRRVRLAVYSLLLSVVLFLLSAIAVVGQRDIETARLPSPDLPAQRTNTVRQYIVRPVRDKYQRTEIARTGAAIDAVGSDWVLISANEIESDAVADLGYSVQPIFPSSGLLVFPDYDAEYHDYDEMVAEIVQAAADHLDTVELFSIGRSYEGRDLWMAKISDHPALDEAEPEILFSAHQHGKEHLAVEQALYTLRVLTDEYHTNPQVRHLVDSREIFVLLT
jgi:carboxypeptidase T